MERIIEFCCKNQCFALFNAEVSLLHKGGIAYLPIGQDGSGKVIKRANKLHWKLIFNATNRDEFIDVRRSLSELPININFTLDDGAVYSGVLMETEYNEDFLEFKMSGSNNLSKVV